MTGVFQLPTGPRIIATERFQVLQCAEKVSMCGTTRESTPAPKVGYRKEAVTASTVLGTVTR